jgi:hypothetical protein
MSAQILKEYMNCCDIPGWKVVGHWRRDGDPAFSHLMVNRQGAFHNPVASQARFSYCPPAIVVIFHVFALSIELLSFIWTGIIGTSDGIRYGWILVYLYGVKLAGTRNRLTCFYYCLWLYTVLTGALHAACCSGPNACQLPC